MSTLPDSPMVLDVTGQAMVTKLEAIRLAILNSGGGGGGGGTAFAAPPYDASVARHGTSFAYRYGDYCTYEGVIYRCIVSRIQVTDPPESFDSTKWTAVESLAIELSEKPGRIVDPTLQSEAFGDIASNVSTGYQSHAEGQSTQSTGYQSHAEGQYTQATNNQAHAEGYSTIASGYQAHAEGNGCRATGSGSHAEGNSTEATDYQAHAEGSNTHATGSYSHAEGTSTYAIGNTSHAEGGSCRAEGSYSHAEGSNTKALSYGSHAEGSGSIVQINSDTAHAEGYNTQAQGQSAHAEGYNSKALATYAHAEGYYCEAQASTTHAQGMYSKAKSSYSSANGYYIETEAMYEYSVGKYNKTIPDGSSINWYSTSYVSYAVGDRVKLSGDNTKSIYQCNTAIEAPAGEFDSSKWTVVGTYDNENPILFSVGDGTYSQRSNALEIRRDGTVYLNGIELPKPPSADGTYTLQCTVSDGVVTYAWV